MCALTSGENWESLEWPTASSPSHSATADTVPLARQPSLSQGTGTIPTYPRVAAFRIIKTSQSHYQAGTRDHSSLLIL